MINYDTYANSYDERYTSEMCKRENEAVAELLRRYNVSELSVLDVGCGTGFALDLCNIRKYKGIDISPKMIEQATKKYPRKTFIARNITTIHLGLEGYECVLCLFSIPYISCEAVEKIYNHLNKGGICICVYYNKPYLNPNSVYHGFKDGFNTEIKPKVKEVIDAFKSRFKTIEEHDLTKDKTYSVSVFRKD